MDSKESGKMGWIERHEAHGSMWCSPGPYVEASMLKVLAKQVSDRFLPEALYDNMTFRGVEGVKEIERSVKSEVEVSAMSLGVRIKDERDSRGADLEEDGDGEDGEDYSETEDDEEVGGSS